MRLSLPTLSALAGGLVLGLLPCTIASADDGKNPSQSPATKSPAKGTTSRAKAEKAQAKAEEDLPEINLLDAVRDGLVEVNAEGKGDGRMTMTVTNKTRRQLRVILPPGIIAQGATGQFGGMGGGGGGMGGGMGGGGMGCGMGGGM